MYDPDTNLKHQRIIAKALVEHTEGTEQDRDSLGERLAELVLELDKELSTGAFLPVRWEVKTT